MPIVKKPRATKEACHPFRNDCEVSVQAGQRPIKDVVFPDGTLGLRPMQQQARDELIDAPAWILNSGTGSGKSIAQKLLAYSRSRLGEKCIIAVPETSIARSFNTDTARYRLNENLDCTDVMAWTVRPQDFLFENGAGITEKTITERLLDFITAKVLPPGANIIVCTHAALVRAHRELMLRWAKKGFKGKSPWKGVNLYIDEAHHARTIEGATEEDMIRSNRLGELVEHYIEKKPGRIGLTTATWLRGDAQSIVPDSCLPFFKVYEYPMDEYLQGLNHLKEIAFKFSIDDYEDALVKEFEAAPLKSLIYQPTIKSGDGSEKKLEYRDAYMKALQPFDLNIVDMVTPEGRTARRRVFEADQDAADVVLVQNTFREGADWPMARRSLVLGARGSLPMVVQMVGRLIRDYPGKSRIEFHIILPKSILNNMAEFETYTSTIFMVMALGWQFTSGLRIPPVMRRAATLKTLIEKFQAKSVRGTEKSAGEEIRDALTEACELEGEKATEEEVEEASKSLLACMKGAFRVAARAASEYLSAKEASALHEAIEADPLKAAQGVYEAQWNKERFQAFRAEYVGLPEVTPEYVDRVIILHRCIYFQQKGQYVDPRTIPGVVPYFGTRAALDTACREVGL